MQIKHRTESHELLTLRYLNSRMKLDAKWSMQYTNLEKGFQGELIFDEWLETLPDNFLILNDLLLEHNHSLFQIDSLIISQKTIYNINVKSNDGEYYIEGDTWYSKTGKETKDPLLQLKRSESLLRQLMKELGFENFRFESYLVFVNPEFYLYQAPRHLPLIFPSQIKRFIHHISIKAGKISNHHKRLAKKLVALHIKKPQNARLPEYNYNQLKKGITCKNCRSFKVEQMNEHIICKNCGRSEWVVSSVLRSADEFRHLFPDRKINIGTVYEWCQVIKSKKTIQRILSSHYKLQGYGRSSYYVQEDECI